MTVINFEVIKYKEKVKGICVKCGKKKQRMIKAEQTVNPFNKDEAGNPKINLKSKNQHWTKCLKDGIDLLKKDLFVQLVKNIWGISKIIK